MDVVGVDETGLLAFHQDETHVAVQADEVEPFRQPGELCGQFLRRDTQEAVQILVGGSQ